MCCINITFVHGGTVHIGVCFSANDFFSIISLPATVVAVVCDKLLLDLYRMSAQSCVLSEGS